MKQTPQPDKVETKTPRWDALDAEIVRQLIEANAKGIPFSVAVERAMNLIYAEGRTLETSLAGASEKLEVARQFKDGIAANIKCGACAEGIFCGSVMHEHDKDCVYTERDSALSKIGELETEVIRLKEGWQQCNQDKNTHFDQSCQNLKRAETAEQELASLRQQNETLRKYSRHTVTCGVHEGQSCDCGFDEALNQPK